MSVEGEVSPPTAAAAEAANTEGAGETLDTEGTTEPQTTGSPPNVEQNGHAVPQDAPPTSDPDGKTERTEATTHEEYETFEDGKRTKVRTSTSERKEFSHTVRRKVYGPEGVQVHTSEFRDFPSTMRTQPDTTDFSEATSSKTQHKIPVRTVNENETPVTQERVISASRPMERNESQDGVPVKMTTFRSRVPVQPTTYVSSQVHEDMKRQYEAVIARLRNQPSSAQTTLERETTKEHLQRRIILLESDLKDSKHVSEMLSEDLQALRKQYEYMVSRNLQIENSNRVMHEKLRDLKSVNKKMSRELTEKDELADRLREAYNREKRTQRMLAEMEEEHTKLVRDYDVLRQTYNRKKQQINEFFTERADLFRKLDSLQYEKQQLERQLGSSLRSKSSAQLKYAYGRSTTSRRHSKPDSPSRKHRKQSVPTASSPTLTSYGHLPPGLMPTETRHEDDTCTVQPDLTDQDITPTTSQAVKDGKPVKEDDQSPGLLPSTSAQPITVETGENAVPADDTTQDSPKISPPDAQQLVSNDPERIGDATDGTGQEEDPTYIPDTFCRSTTSRAITNGESPDEEFYNYYYHANTSDPRMHAHKNSLLRKHYRRHVEPPSPFPKDHRMDTCRRSTQRRRPSSAYGYTMVSPREYEVYRSPLPPRSTTSIGRRPPSDYVVRSPERDYSHSYKSSSRKKYGTLPQSPNPFKYDSVRQTKDEITQLEYALAQLKREKRRIEKELYAGHLPRSHGRSEELSDMLQRIGLEIYGLQSRLAVLKTMR